MNKSISDQLSSSSYADGKYYIILFIIWPFLAFLSALTNYNQKESRIVVYLFLIYYGLTFSLSGTSYVDASGYAMALKANSRLPFSDFFKIVGGIYATDTSVDIVEPFISFIVSRITDDHRILFAVFAAIFGFFYLRSISLLYNRYKENPGWNVAIHLAFFTIILPISAINGFRMWTAAWIFFYGAYYVVLYRNPKYLLVALSASLVHWSFISANAVLFIYYFAGNRNLIYLPLAIVSFILPRLVSPIFQIVSHRFGGAIQNRFESYSNEGYIASRQLDFEQSTWFLKLSESFVLYYFLFAIIIIQLMRRKSSEDKIESNLFSFMLLFLAFVNFGKAIPSFGERFQTIFIMFATFYVLLNFAKQPGDRISVITLIGLFPMVLNAAVTFRQSSESINAWILAPGLGLPLVVPGLPLAEFLFR